MQKYKNYIGQTVNAKYTVEHNIDGADVPLLFEGNVTPYLDSDGYIFLDTDYGLQYPFNETFELIETKKAP